MSEQQEQAWERARAAFAAGEQSIRDEFADVLADEDERCYEPTCTAGTWAAGKVHVHEDGHVMADAQAAQEWLDAEAERIAKVRAACDRELAQVTEAAGGKREPELGCSTISHDRVGFCAGCTRSPSHELLAWRLLALREQA